MVKFGRHLEAYQHNNLRNDDFFVVPYNSIKTESLPSYVSPSYPTNKLHKIARQKQKKFISTWTHNLHRAKDDFERITRIFWTRVFNIVSATASADEMRGALPDTALRLYLGTASEEDVQSLYSHLKDVHSTAVINSEALRKLVKKFDKDVEKVCGVSAGGDDLRLSGRLLPDVYTANFTVGLPTVEAGMSVLSQYLQLNEEEEDEDEMSEIVSARIKALTQSMNMEATSSTERRSPTELPSNNDVSRFFGLLRRVDTDAVLVQKRREELHWLRTLVQDLETADEKVGGNGNLKIIKCLVGHRGFHSVKDRSDRRPLENSLMAYEMAWTNGVQLCECDIVLTRDEKLILAHDDNFTRLALDPDDPLVQRKVTDLTYKEIMSLPLKSGVRPPLLFDVLRSAHAIGGEARMIVEIKPGCSEAGTALAKMFARNPQLMERCAVVMSFDAFAMQNLRRELGVVFPVARSGMTVRKSARQLGSLARVKSTPNSSYIQIPTAMSISNITNIASMEPPAATATAPPVNVKPRNDSIDSSQLGMSLSAATFEPIPDEKSVEDATPHPVLHNAEETPIIPKLLLITRSGPAQNEEQKDALQIDVSKPTDLSRVSNWLRGGGGDTTTDNHHRTDDNHLLDGLYMQFQPYMVNTPEGMEAMRALADNYTIGIWGANPKCDDYTTFHHLVRECGVSYVNSSLPKNFFKIPRQWSGGALREMGSDIAATDGAGTEENMIEANSVTWPRQPHNTASMNLGLPW